MQDTEGTREVLFYGKLSVERHLSKKNKHIALRTKSGRPYITWDKSVKTAENNLLLQLQSQKNRTGPHKPIGFDVHCVFKFFYRDYYTKKGTRSRFVGDLSNLFELIQDCLTKAGIIEDDSLICSLDGSRRIPSNENYLEVTIFKFTEDIENNTLELNPRMFD